MTIKRIGRFTIIRELGRGAQGAVYLAYDPQLDRQVAIKTLRPGAAQTEILLREARIVSKLQHANIVPLHDAGESDGSAYLVCAYIEGGTLATMLQHGALPAVKSAEIACYLLDALEYAHQHGVMHLDIKPANIMIGQRGQPMLTDFGIARLIQGQSEASREVVGSPQYMAPESINGEGVNASSDLYSLGIVLYEMVTGVVAFQGENVMQILNRVAHEPVAAPSAHNAELDEKLEAIILKSVGKRREERYPDAAAMRAALKEYLGGIGEAAANDSHSTLDFLLRRMRSKSDFPALSNIITEINQIVASESDSANKLARVILQDFALTNKLLRLVNTVSYGQFGGNISTISKAVVIMGFETVRNIAMSLIMLEFMQNKSLAHQLKDEVIAAFFAGVVATQLAVGRNIRDAEELMICAMFQNLGRMLVTYYFFEESQEIARLIEQGLTEEQAAIKVLGLTHNEIGIGVARSWSFPKRLLDGMEKLPQGEAVKKPKTEAEHMKATVNMANELCVIAAATATQEKAQALNRLRLRYQDAIDISERKLNDALESGLKELSRRAMTLEINTARSPLVKKVRQWSGLPVEQPAAEHREQREGMNGVHGIESVLNAEAQEDASARPDPETVMGAGIQDVTNSLVEDFNLNDVLLMVLETIYRGLGFKRAIICIRDNKSNAMVARMGLGEDVDAVIPRFRFNLAFEPDVFHLAVDKGVDIVIEDLRAESIASKVPAWYRGLIDAQSFILLPIVINKKTLGLFYADMQQANSLKLSERQLSLLRTLRNQAVLAIKQKM
ncbi:serine/threonine-protein kinase PknD [Sideroxyarcus emersonii]|uniref:Serine/threonine-protein kinase PknD n=1 Tax=Sideroxyarcus emersonii TaxID=2764705 RepID=A0AAN1X9R4_9PROT|nr:serine/threonine protein kinase [Sideroxyarcus emersonii]BCK87301.1 serine/threonine-protein kinase PknD [Sideroxyarcus emersonii]